MPSFPEITPPTKASVDRSMQPLDYTRRNSIGPVPAAPAKPSFAGPRYIGPDGLLVSDGPESIVSNIGTMTHLSGQSLGGELGIMDLKNPVGAASNWARDDLFDSYRRNLDVEFYKRLDPEFNPSDDQTLPTITGRQFYKTNIPATYRDVIAPFGYDEAYFGRFDNGLDARTAYKQALFMTRQQQAEERFNNSHGWAGRQTSLVGNFIVEMLADPVNLASIGIEGAIKKGATTTLAKVAGKTLSRDIAEAAGQRYVHALGMAAVQAGQYRLQAAADETRQTEVFKRDADQGFETSDQLRFDRGLMGLGPGFSALFGVGLGYLFGPSLGRHPSEISRNAMTAAAAGALESDVHLKVPAPDNAVEVAATATKLLPYDAISAEMRKLTGNETALSDYWKPELLQEYEKVGLTPEKILAFIRKGPSETELKELFTDAARASEKLSTVETSWIRSDRPEPEVLKDYEATYSSRNIPLAFESPVDKALYSLQSPGFGYKNTVMTHLRAVFPEFDDAQITNLSLRVSEAVNDAAQAVAGGGKMRAREVAPPEWTPAALKTNFEARSAGHTEFSKSLDTLVSEGTLTVEHADVLREVFFGTDGDWLKSIKVSSNSRLKATRGRASIGGEPRIELQSRLAARDLASPHTATDSGKTLLHEYAHLGHQHLLGDSEQKLVDTVFRSKTRKEWEQFFDEGFEGNSATYAASPAEFFAESFARWVLQHKVADTRLMPLWQRFGLMLKNGLERLKGRKPLKDLEPIYEKLLTGDRGFDTTKPVLNVGETHAKIPAVFSKVFDDGESGPDISGPVNTNWDRPVKGYAREAAPKVSTVESSPAKAEPGVPEEKGKLLDKTDAYKVLDSKADQVLPPSATPRMAGGLIPKAVKKRAIWAGQRFATTGIERTVYSNFPAIRRITDIIHRGALSEEAFQGLRRRIPSLEDGRREQKAISARHTLKNQKIRAKFNLSDAEVDTAYAHAFRLARASGTPEYKGPNAEVINKAAAEFSQNFRRYFDDWGNRGQASGYFSKPLPRYVPAVIRSNMKHQVTEIADRVYRWWLSQWTREDAQLHLKTLTDLGIIKNRKFDVERFPQYTPGTVLKSLKDLTPEHRTQYLEALKDRNGALGQQADSAIRRRLGLAVRDEDTGSSLTALGVEADATKIRTMQDEVWFTDELLPFIETDLDVVINRYGDSTGYRVLRQETTNQLTGRRDIKWNDYWDWYKGRTLERLSGTDHAKVKESFTALENKERHLSGAHGLADDGTLDVPDFFVTTGTNLARTAISAKNGLQQMTTEWAPILLKGGLSAEQVVAISEYVMRGLDQSALAGMSYMREGARTLATRGIWELDAGLSHNRTFLDSAVRNPLRQIKESVSEAGQSVPRKVANLAMSLSGALAQFTRAVAGEDQINTLTKIGAVGGEKFRFAKNWKGISKMSDLLAAEKGPLDEKGWKGLCRKAGLDPVYAARLNDSGLFDPAVVGQLRRLNELDPSLVSRHKVGKTLDADHLADRILGQPVEDRKGFNSAMAAVYRHIEEEVDRISVRPGVADVNTAASASNPYNRLFNAFLTWNRAWFNKRLVDSMGNERIHRAYGAAGMTLFLEFMYMQGNKYLYRGYSVDDLKDEWDDNPESVIAQGAMRTNFLGAVQEPLFFALNELVKFDPRMANSTGGTNLVMSNGIATFRALMKAPMSLIDSDAELNDRDYRNLLRITPLLNLPFVQAIAKAAGHKSMTDLLLGEDR